LQCFLGRILAFTLICGGDIIGKFGFLMMNLKWKDCAFPLGIKSERDTLNVPEFQEPV
jgi:hypothetical protein